MKRISRKYLILVISSLLLMISHVVQAEVPKIASTHLRVDTSELNKLWFDAMNLLSTGLSTGELLETNLKLTELDLKKVEIGLKNLPEHSAVLIKHANTLKKQRQLPEAIKLLESAKQLSPDFAAVYFALAKFRFAHKMTDVYGIGRELLHGLLLKYKDISTLVAYINNGLAFLLLSCLITGAVFILFSFAYYRRAIFFHLKEVFPLPLPMFIANIVGWVLVGIITLALGIFWGILFLALLLIPHIEPASKGILPSFLLLGSLIAVLLIAVSITFTAFDGNYFQALRDVSYGDYSMKTVNILQKRLQEYPDDTYALFGLAYITRSVGNFQDAIEVYEMIASQHPDRAAVQNNLGNLYHLQFRKTKQQTWYQKAEEAYRSAIRYSPKMFEPRYNSGQLLMVEFTQSEDAGEQLAAARRFDMERFTRYSGYLEHDIVTVDASFSTLTLLKKLYAQESLNAGLALAKNLWASGSRLNNPWYFSIVSFVLLLMTSFSGTKKEAKKKKVNYCQMCGDPYTVKQRKKSEDKDKKNLCTQCTYIFKKKTTVKSEKRVEKVKQIQLRQKTRGLIAKIGSLCFPGSGQIYFGYIVKGILISFVFYLALVIFLLKFLHIRILLETEGSSGSSLITQIIILLLLLGTYLFNIYDIRKLSPKNQ